MMITAKEALEISHAGDAVDRYLEEEVAPMIKAAAAEGKNQCDINWIRKESYVVNEPTTFETIMMDKLRNLGYCVSFEKLSSTYVPRDGLDHDGDVPQRINNYGYRISWRPTYKE